MIARVKRGDFEQFFIAQGRFLRHLGLEQACCFFAAAATISVYWSNSSVPLLLLLVLLIDPLLLFLLSSMRNHENYDESINAACWSLLVDSADQFFAAVISLSSIADAPAVLLLIDALLFLMLLILNYDELIDRWIDWYYRWIDRYHWIDQSSSLMLLISSSLSVPAMRKE